MRRMIRILAAVALGAAPAAAQGDSLVIREFRSDVVVRSDGDLEVTETLRVAFFGPWNGVEREISRQHRTARGRRAKLGIDVQPPTDERGQALRYETENRDGWTRLVRVWVPGAHDAERTLVIRYTVHGAMRFFEEGSEPGPLDELYWNVTGSSWRIPIDRAVASFTLPSGATARQVAAYTGPEGSTASEADVQNDGRTVRVVTRRRLEAYEGLTVGVGWAPGSVTRPSAGQVALAEAGRRWPFALPVLAFIFALRTWRRRGRDPQEQAIVVQYEPPHRLTPAELGTLIDHKVDMREITATLVDLAVRGYLGIEEKQEKQMLGLFTSTEYVFHLRRPRESWGELADHERLYISALFAAAHMAATPWEAMKAVMSEARRARDAGETLDQATLQARLAGTNQPPAESVEMSQLRNRFYTSLPGIRNAVYDSLMARGFYLHRPDRAVALWVGLSIPVLIGSVILGIVASENGWGWIDGVALGVGGGLSALVLLGFGLVMPARTEAGARAREAALGFREFLDKVESDRYKRMITSPDLFERFLPYAMAFGVEDHWARAFDDLLTEPPDWYYGGRGMGFRATSFTSHMSSMSSQAGSTMSSSPSSSGSGGGGSSGGGSGGGGGGGF